MIVLAESARADRLMREHAADYVNRLTVVRNIVSNYLLGHPLEQNMPSVADFSWYTPIFRGIMDRERGAFFEMTELPSDTLELALDETVRKWRRRMQRRLYEMIPPEARPVEAEEAIKHAKEEMESASSTATDVYQDVRVKQEIVMALLHATTWFRCTECQCLLDFPRVQAHRCLKTGPPIKLDRTTDADDRANAYNLVLKEFPWNYTGDKVHYDMDARRAAEKVIRVSGLNVEETETFDMDFVSHRFACGKCSAGGTVCVMPWRVAVRHSRLSGDAESTVVLTMLVVTCRSLISADPTT